MGSRGRRLNTLNGRLFIPSPTAEFGEFLLGHCSQQLGHVDEIGLINRQLVGALFKLCT